MSTFESIAQFFPLVLAPGVVALARGRWPGVHRAVDGLLVWLAVTGAAVLWTLAIGAAFGEPFGPDMVRRGFLLGLVSACGHTLAKYRPKPADPPEPDAVAAPPPKDTPFTATRDAEKVGMDLDFGSRQ